MFEKVTLFRMFPTGKGSRSEKTAETPFIFIRLFENAAGFMPGAPIFHRL